MKRCGASAASSASTTAAWSCRRTSTVGAVGRGTCSGTMSPCGARGKVSFILVFAADRKPEEEGAKRKRGPAKSVCPFYKASALQHMRDAVLGAVQDIEQLVRLGRETQACPYYSTRLAIPPAQVASGYCSSCLTSGSLVVFADVRSCWLHCLCGFLSWWCCRIRCCFTRRREKLQESS